MGAHGGLARSRAALEFVLYELEKRGFDDGGMAVFHVEFRDFAVVDALALSKEIFGESLTIRTNRKSALLPLLGIY